jgi:antibiotic biosynthesis monooxygenase (ABM) superfamily enzyme
LIAAFTHAAFRAVLLEQTCAVSVAITRRVRAGREAEFQQALREFMQTSFDDSSVLGVSMIVPPPGTDSREYGILRTFANETDRDAFYGSTHFKNWEQKAQALTEGTPERRELHGLEAWFRSRRTRRPGGRWRSRLSSASFPRASCSRSRSRL